MKNYLVITIFDTDENLPPNYNTKAGLKSKLECLLEKNEPEILVDKEHAPGTVPTFSLQELYNDLFVGGDIRKGREEALIKSSGFPTSSRGDYLEKLSFMLPESILNVIKCYRAEKQQYNKRKKTTETIVVEVYDKDYNAFFTPSTDNRKISPILHSCLVGEGKCKIVIEKIRSHIIGNIINADYSNVNLFSYLQAVGDYIIVPKNISPDANAAFHKLLSNGDYSTIVANFLISALFGLASVDFVDADNSYNNARTKAYLLSTLGMKFIWVPKVVTSNEEELSLCSHLYNLGEYQKAYQATLKWKYANGNNATPKEFAIACQIIGSCLVYHTESCTSESGRYNSVHLSELRREGVEHLKTASDNHDHPEEALYSLYEYYKLYCDNENMASEYLNKAFALGYPKAVIEVAELYIADKEISYDKKVILSKLTLIIDNWENHTNTDVSKCLYLRGCIYEKNQKADKAEADLKKAAEMGHERARMRIRRDKRIEQRQIPLFVTNAKEVCFVNSFTGNNYEFLKTVPDKPFSLYSTANAPYDINAIKVDSIDSFIEETHLDKPNLRHSKTVFMFMSEDETKNLNECLFLLDKLFNIALKEKPTGLPEKLIDSIDIYVGARYDVASTLIDASINDMGDIYFKVHIADETRDSVHSLLCEAPLFIPYLNKSKKEAFSNVVLFGCTETNYRFIKESIACLYLKDTFPITITLIGEYADRLEKRFRQECPGIYKGYSIKHIVPQFISCSIEETDFPNYIYGNSRTSDEPIAQALSTGNYFVVDLENDNDSMHFAMNLRMWLLRSRDTFDRTPFIAVKCSNMQNSYLMQHLTLSGQAAGNSYYSRYDLFPFGIAGKIYSYNNLIAQPLLENTALRIHKSYYGDGGRKAENDYFSFSYNADSSILTAIGLAYRLFAGNAYFAHSDDYLNLGLYHVAKQKTVKLINMYSDYRLENEETAGEQEHYRWCSFMLSRAWESASIQQVQAYKKQATGSAHKHTLAKLHPFITSWNDLNDDKLKTVLNMLETSFGYKKSPKDTTIQSIRDTEVFFGLSAKTKNREH